MQIRTSWQRAQSLLYDDLEQAKDLATHGMDIAIAAGIQEGLAQCYHVLGAAHELQGYLDEAREFYGLALEKALRSDSAFAAEIRHQIGVTYFLEGNRGRALEHFHEALLLAREVKQSSLQSTNLTFIGEIYEAQGKLPEALASYNQVLNLAASSNRYLEIASIHQKIGRTLANMGKSAASILSFKKAIKFYHKLQLTEETSEAKIELAQALYHLGRKIEAKSVLSQALTEFENYLPEVKANVYLLTAKMALDEGNYQRAKVNLDSGFILIDNTNREHQKSSFLAAYVEYYVAQGDFAQALLYSERNQEVLDTLNQIAVLNYEKEMAIKYEVQEKEAALAIAVEKNARASRERNWLIALMVLLALLLAATIRYASFKHKANQELTAHKQVIEKSLKEKEVLLKEIHHRVKNNLQVVSSLLNLQARTAKGEEQAQALQEGKNRVKSMALIHRDLYRAENLEGISTGKYIERLCRSLLASYQHSSREIELETDVEDMTLDIDTIIPLGLILNELITNSLKYAFDREDPGGKITVGLHRNGEQIDLVVKDNGRGISLVDLDFKKSMGFRLIEAFSRKLGGNFKITNERGAAISLSFRAPQLTVSSVTHG